MSPLGLEDDLWPSWKFNIVLEAFRDMFDPWVDL